MGMTESESKTIFALEDGEYSDYHVIGIYTTRERAEAIQQKVGGSIAEWTLDAGIAEINAGLTFWRILMLQDGTTEKIWSVDISGYNIGDSHFHIWKRTEAPAYRGRGIPDCLDCNIWARNQKHAIKIANEKRTRMIAEGNWS